MSSAGFLTHIKDASLPHPAVNYRILLAIEEGVRTAWQTLVGNPTSLAALKDEKTKEVNITVDLEYALDAILKSGTCPAFTDEHFLPPKRGAEHVTFDGKLPEKRPDFTFTFKNRRPGVDLSNNDAVFAECKILCDTTKKNIKLYASQGLIKFVRGDYAWAMKNALMIAYIRTPHPIPITLDNYFKAKTKGVLNATTYNLVAYPALCPKSKTLVKYQVCTTEHKRTWFYPPCGTRSPGNIKIRHLWLNI